MIKKNDFNYISPDRILTEEEKREYEEIMFLNSIQGRITLLSFADKKIIEELDKVFNK